MGHTCKYCKKGRYPNDPRSFFQFPKDLHLKKKWIDILNIREELKDSNRICSDHFEAKFLKKCGKKLTLKVNAYPYVSPSAINKTDFDDVPASHFIKIEPNYNNDDVPASHFIKIEPSDNNEMDFMESSIEANGDSISYSDIKKEIDSNYDQSEKPVPETVRTIYSRCDFASDEAYEDFLKYDSYRKKQIHALHCKVYKRDLANSKLKENNASLKEEISKMTAYNLENVPSTIKELISRCNESAANSTKSYSTELMEFASSLHFLSPAAYEFVRERFSKTLPATKTLNRLATNNILHNSMNNA